MRYELRSTNDQTRPIDMKLPQRSTRNLPSKLEFEEFASKFLRNPIPTPIPSRVSRNMKISRSILSEPRLPPEKLLEYQRHQFPLRRHSSSPPSRRTCFFLFCKPLARTFLFSKLTNFHARLLYSYFKHGSLDRHVIAQSHT